MATASVNPAVPWSSDLLKDIYAYAVCATRYYSVRWRLLSRGGNGPLPFTVEDLGNVMGKRYVWNLFYDDPGSAIVADATTRSFDGHGQKGISEGRFAYTPSRIPFRTTADEQEIQYMSNDAGTMLNTTMRKLEALLFKCAHVMNSLLKYSGRHAQIGVVTTGNTVTTGTDVEITFIVPQVLDIPRGQSVIFRAADGTAITNSVYGILIAKSVKSGAGTITIQFPTVGTQFVVADGALICIPGATQGSGNGTERTFFEGMPALVGTGAFPTASIGNNTSLTDPQYEAVVQNVDAKITSLILRAILSKVKTTAATHGLSNNIVMSGMTHPSFDENGYPVRQKFVWHMSEASQLKLETDFWNGGRTAGLQRHTMVSGGFGEGTAIDEGRMYKIFCGVPIINDDSAKDDEIYLLSTDSFASGMLEAFVPYSYRQSGWNAIPGTEKYELVRQIRGLLAVIYRDANARIYRDDGSIFGYTFDEMAALDPSV